MVLSTGGESLISRCLTNMSISVDRESQELSMTAPLVTRTFKVTPLPRWFTRMYDFASGSSYGHYPCDGCQLNLVAPAATTLPICSHTSGFGVPKCSIYKPQCLVRGWILARTSERSERFNPSVTYRQIGHLTHSPTF